MSFGIEFEGQKVKWSGKYKRSCFKAEARTYRYIITCSTGGQDEAVDRGRNEDIV